jgi:hypothetical protein
MTLYHTFFAQFTDYALGYVADSVLFDIPGSGGASFGRGFDVAEVGEDALEYFLQGGSIDFLVFA